MNKFFKLLTKSIDKSNVTPNNIYNIEETGISTVPKNMSKLIVKGGKIETGTLTLAELGKTINIEICMSASGIYVLRFIIHPALKLPRL